MSTAQFTNMTRAEAERFMANAKPQRVRTRLAEIVGGQDVIDLGCGKGEEISDLYTPDQYFGVDCSAELIRLAREQNPQHLFAVAAAQEVGGYWPFAIIKSVLEHLPPDEAAAVYHHARTLCATLLVAWHVEPNAGVRFAKHWRELDTPIQQNRHDPKLFGHVVMREVWPPHWIWVVSGV